MNIPRLVVAVQNALSDDLRGKRWRYRPDMLVGQCYVAAECLFHLLGGKRSPWRPRFMRVHNEPHWFLRNEKTWAVLDPTELQFAHPLDYGEGEARGFLTGYDKPSKRAAELIRRVKVALGERAAA